MKNSDIALIALALGAVGVGGYFLLRPARSSNPLANGSGQPGTYAYGGQSVSAQPGIKNGNQYAISHTQNQPRADNANQPYYGGDRSFLGSTATVASSASSIANSVSSLWDTLDVGNWFSSSSPDTNADGQFDFQDNTSDYSTEDLAYADTDTLWSDYDANQPDPINFDFSGVA